MTNHVESSSSVPHISLATVLGLGAFRSALVNSITYPLELIKTNQQINKSPIKSYSVAHKILKSDGLLGFYRGFSPHFIKGMVKQSVWWPVIAFFPPILDKFKISQMQQYAIMGFSVAALDALVNSPLEKWRILASTKSLSSISTSILFNEGWTGFLPYFRRQGITWSLFLFGQHEFSKHYKKHKEKMSMWHLIITSSKLSVVSNLCIAPFDTLNTLKQNTMNSLQKPLQNTGASINIRQLYRGLPLNFISMMVQISATVFLIDLIETRRGIDEK